jgi:hypothetical protein
MIRLRDARGRTIDLEKNSAVEITGDDGAVALAIYQDQKGTIRILAPGDALFSGYCKSNGVPPAKVHIHEMPTMKGAALS